LAEMREVAAMVGTDVIRAHAASAEAAMASDPAEARRWLEDAVDLFEKARAPYEAARARVDLANVLRTLGREQFAREELLAARDVFRRLGAVVEVEKAPESPLTKREIEVLRLVAKGMSDKEVAASLRLSEHTVHRHVANILGKLDVNSRAAAVGMAVSGHLLH
ncbi:MAG TPA: LuxR C-terminal-related transcriptional regulator, partial [Thermoanaerobaculia bacterium]